MDAYRALISKRDTRTFSDEPVDEDALQRVLKAARMAGSAKNRQPVRLVVVRETEQKTQLSKCGDFSSWIPTAAVNVAVVMPEGERDFDAGRAAQNLMVGANAEGLASCPVTMHHPECAAKVLELPADHRVAIVIAIGHGPRKHEGEGREGAARVSLDDYVHYERW